MLNGNPRYLECKNELIKWIAIADQADTDKDEVRYREVELKIIDLYEEMDKLPQMALKG